MPAPAPAANSNPSSLSCGPDAQGRPAHNLLPRLLAQRQCTEIVEVLLYLRNAGPRPVRPEQCLIRNFFQPRKVAEQRLRWNAADIQKHIRMPPQQEKRRVHPERTAAMRQ